jgi:hypothetical protein
MEKMTLLDFMTWFLSKQTKGWLVREILNLETDLRHQQGFKEYWNRLAEQCQVELVNMEPDWTPPTDWNGEEEE